MQSRRAAPADDSRGSRVTDETASSSRARRGSAEPDSGDGDPSGSTSSTSSAGERVDLSGLSVAGITRRRVGFVASTFVGIWIVLVFARQVGDAATASSRATQLAADNQALAAEVQSLQDEVDAITTPAHVSLAARAYQLGAPKEIAFALDPSIPAPVDGAPGSASVRLGATTDRPTPLESWLSLLFGPAN